MNFFTVFDDFSDAWFTLLHSLIRLGLPAKPRDQATHELLGVNFTVKNLRGNILVHPIRQLGYRFMVAEWLWIAAGHNDVKSMQHFSKLIDRFSDDGETFYGAYGPRLDNQWNYLVGKLQDAADTRQAVATIWTPNPPATKDYPCTLSWQLLIRHGALHAIVTMRSSDIWLGLPYDFFNFSQLTNMMASTLKLPAGSLTFNLGSSHLYDRDLDKARQVIASPALAQTVWSPSLLMTDASRSWAEATLRRAVMVLDGKPCYDSDILIEPWRSYYTLLINKQDDPLLILKRLETYEPARH
jgi:thymidylate synthase